MSDRNGNQAPGFYNRQPGEPTLSLCMMVKDEEARLRTVLDSAVPWVDELVVVDTGSTDRTVEIAESYGAKVYHHPWENDFAKHRNQSLSYATGDWMLVLDADEELDQETAPIIRQAIRHPTIEAFLVELVNMVPSGGATFLLHARVFRNHTGFHYEGKVHNRPVVLGPSTNIPVKLYHYGYALDAVTMEAKHQRRVEMIRKWVADEPENYLSHSYLAQTLASKKATEAEAVDEALIAIDLIRREGQDPEQMPRAYYPMLIALSNMNRTEEVIKHSLDCLEAVPFYPDPYYFLTWAYLSQGRWEEVIQEAHSFFRSQGEALKHQEKFIFIENMTRNQFKWVHLRWIMAAVHLGRVDEAVEVMGRLLAEEEPELVVKMALQDLLNQDFPEAAERLAAIALEAHPEWEWHQRYARALAKARARGRAVAAAEAAPAQGPTDRASLLALARQLDQDGKHEEAASRYMAGLCGGSGDAWAWLRLAEMAEQAGNHLGAEALYRRVKAMDPAKAEAAAGLARAQAVLKAEPPLPTVAQAPPRLVVFLVPGLSPEMVRVAAPHMLMHTAWGELVEGPGQDGSSDPAWATLYTGVTPQVHGITEEQSMDAPQGLAGLKTPSLWELLAADMRVGLVSAPLACPPPNLGGWALAGWPHGLLTPASVNPPELAPVALASGFRPDHLADALDEYTYCGKMEQSYSQEAALYQLERNRITTAMAMPAVEVLALGIYTVERVQNCFGMDPSNYRTGAYQQVYSCLESLLAALKPQHYAFISQRGCGSQAGEHKAGGFYCLSWLRGEGGKARATDIAPEILKLMGVNPAGLGQGR